MTKQEKIQEAYGEHFKICNPDENGWCKYNESETTESGTEPFGDCEISCGYGDIINWRPKSLQGISNNNGWIKIESEDDLPENGYYEVVVKETGEMTRASLDCEYRKKSLANYYSHYQPIEIKQPPLH